MNELAAAVLPLIRTRADLSRRGAANGLGRQIHAAVRILESATETGDSTVVVGVRQQVIASAMRVIMHADDSSGIIGDACRALLDMHPRIAPRARPPIAGLVHWMSAFQIDNHCDYFTLDPVAYAAALGENPSSARRSGRRAAGADAVGRD